MHFHVVWLDGVYSWQPGRGEVAWHEHEGLTDADVAALAQRIGGRVRRVLKKAVFAGIYLFFQVPDPNDVAAFVELLRGKAD